MKAKPQARKVPVQQNAAQIRQDYENAVDTDLIKFIEDVHSTPDDMVNNLDFRVSKVSEKQRTDIERLTGEPLNANSNFIKGDRIVHIEDRHGKNGKADQSMADPNDIARIGYVLENYDAVDFLRDEKTGKIVTNSNYTAKNGMPSPSLIYVKKVNGFYIVIEAVNDGKRKRLNIISAYKNRKNPLTAQKARMPDGTSAPKQNVQNASATDINDTSKFKPEVN